MNINKWTKALLSAGLISLPAMAQAGDAAVPNTVLTSLKATTLSGYIDTSAVWKFGTGNQNMPARTYDGPDVQDGFNMNVVSLTLDKPLDEAEWSAGYHLQMLFGPGAVKRGTGSLKGGVDTNGDGFNDRTAGDFSFNEAYVLLHAPICNGLDVKIGQFGTYNGFEAYDTYKNPNWSRSYGFFIESSAHTGVSATYVINPNITVMGGVGNIAGYNNQVDARGPIESKKAYLGMISITCPDNFGFLSGSSISVGYTTGDNQRDITGTSSSYTVLNPPGFSQGNFYVGGTLNTPVAGLKLGFAYDYTTGQVTKNDYANATALYVLYETGKWKFNNRFDYASSTSGRFDAVDSGSPDRLFSYTLDVDYSLWANVVSRLEFRYDRSLSGDRPFGGTTAGSPINKQAISLGLNVIYLF